MKKSELSIIFGLMFSLIITFIADADMQADDIRDNTLRLHIIARDDSALNQHIKTQVKNATENLWPAIYCTASSFDEALQLTQENMDYIQQVTDNTLKNLEAGYTSSCALEKYYFDTTVQNGVTLPRGRYTTLTIKLGPAQGKNWWCVVYPWLGKAVGAEYEEDSTNTVFETDSCRIKFKTVEWLQKAKQYFTDTETYNNL